MNDPSTLPYRETTRSSFMMVLAAGLFVIAVGSTISSSFVDAGVIAVIALIVAWFSSATYEVSERRLSVKIGAGFPHLRIPAESIASVERGSVGAVRSGGLGYRGSWTIGKRVIVSLGASGGVHIRTRPKGLLSLSSNHPDRLAAAISELATTDHPDRNV